MHAQLSQIVQEYRQQFESSPLTADNALFETAQQMLFTE